MSDTASISRPEAEAAVHMIQQQSVVVNEAITKVQRSPSSLPAWRGKRRAEFEQTVEQEIRNLAVSTKAIEESAKRVEAALVALLRADGVSI